MRFQVLSKVSLTLFKKCILFFVSIRGFSNKWHIPKAINLKWIIQWWVWNVPFNAHILIFQSSYSPKWCWNVSITKTLELGYVCVILIIKNPSEYQRAIFCITQKESIPDVLIEEWFSQGNIKINKYILTKEFRLYRVLYDFNKYKLRKYKISTAES